MSSKTQVPANRIRVLRDVPPNPRAQFVLYWMIAQRRARDNFALDRAVEWALELGLPLVVLEALRADYPWKSDRFDQFVIDGMRDNQAAFAETNVFYYPFVGEGRGLLPALAKKSAVVVTDHYPCFFLPRMVAAARERISQRFEAVDSNGLLPLSVAPDEPAKTARGFRTFLAKNIPNDRPRTNFAHKQLAKLKTSPVLAKWPAARLDDGPTQIIAGGSAAAERALTKFLRDKLERYGEDRNHPDFDTSSHLSPYLHFGHISPHHIRERVLAASEESDAATAFLDQVVTWREIGFNMCEKNPAYDQYESLPPWAQRTLEAHAGDPRDPLYSLEELEQAKTYDPIWNAAQNELVSTGRLHNYLRMLWGKKILEWTRHPREALAFMIELNNKYALDGRDPNSYSGIFWILGRYDRPWAPQRPIFGQIRYMSSDSTKRKLKMKNYLARWSV